MKLTSLLATACFVTSVAFAQDLSWLEFAQRPEVWPAQCTVKRPFKFQRGAVAAGQKVAVLNIRADRIELGTADGMSFAAKPDETDAFTLGSAIWKMLSPKQRELTYATLLQRKDLWPYRVT